MKRVPLIAAALAVVVLSGLAWVLLRRPASDGEVAGGDTLVAVRLGQIQRTTLRAYVTAYGVVEPEPAGDRSAAGAQVTAAVPGVVAAVRCVEGRVVEKGAVLFQLDSRVADVAVSKAQQAVELAETTLQREQKLIQAEGTSQKRVVEAESALLAAQSDLAAARAQQSLLRVESPLAGTVTRVSVGPGQGVDPTTVLAEVVDLDRLVVDVGVPSAELVSIHPGAAAEVVVSGSPPLQASVRTISPRVDPATGTAPVRVSLPAGSGLLPGQTARLRIVSDEHRDCLAAPVGSVVKDESGAAVVALVQDGVARQTRVTTGLHDGDWIEVEGEDLAAGMSVVTEGAFGLPAETRVRVLAP
jgi:RND family efflux transporter MFP subunit